MSRICSLTQKKVLVGNNVSHSNRKTKRVFRPNLCTASLYSDSLAQCFKLTISARALKTIDFKGGLDNYLLEASDSVLSREAKSIKSKIQKKLSV